MEPRVGKLPAPKNLALIGPSLQKKNTFEIGQHVSAAGSGSDCLARQDARAGDWSRRDLSSLVGGKQRTTSARGSTNFTYRIVK